MSMSKKDFIALADELGPYLSDHETNNDPLVKADIINALCRFMHEQNPQFKEDRWRAYLAGECGPSGGTIRKTPRGKGEKWPGGGPVLPGDR